MQEASEEATSVFVLVAEDEPLIMMMAKEALEEAGFSVLQASSGAAALNQLEDKDKLVRALVTDIDLGGSETGWMVAKRAREINPDIPIVYITGGGTNEWPANGVPRSIVIAKPFAPVQLVTAVSQLLNAAISEPSTIAPTSG